jgi:TatD DNase family protein
MTSAPRSAGGSGGSPPRVSTVPPPEPLPADAFDSHCHLDLLERPVPEVLADALAARITRVVTIGVDLPTSRWAARCAEAHPVVYAAVAIHPNETARAGSAADRGPADGGPADRDTADRDPADRDPADRDAVLAEIGSLAALPRVRAIGETGLDYYRDSAPPEVQRDWFRAHIEIAKQAGKALMIHDRDAHEDVLRILAADGPPEHVIFHCFSGDAAMAKRCAEAGYVMSFAGNVTFSSAQPLRDAAAAAPADLILAETDAPFLTPVPNRGRPNSPAMVAHTVRAIAEVKQMDVAELCAAVTATGERVFGPWAR